jgi:hypothetical protein
MPTITTDQSVLDALARVRALQDSLDRSQEKVRRLTRKVRVMDAAHVAGTRMLAARWSDIRQVSILANDGDHEAQALVGWVKRRCLTVGARMDSPEAREHAASQIAADLDISSEWALALCNLANWSS